MLFLVCMRLGINLISVLRNQYYYLLLLRSIRRRVTYQYYLLSRYVVDSWGCFLCKVEIIGYRMVCLSTSRGGRYVLAFELCIELYTRRHSLAYSVAIQVLK